MQPNKRWIFTVVLWYNRGMVEKTVNEVEIWTGVISPDRDDMPEPSANTVLGWSFNDDAKVRMEELANRNGRGELTDSEREELEAYVSRERSWFDRKYRASIWESGSKGSRERVLQP